MRGEHDLAKILNLKDAKTEKTPARTIYRFLGREQGAEKICAILVEYEPDVELDGVHYHERRESAYIVLEGSATLKLNGIEHHLEPSTAVLFSPGDIHGIAATGKKGFKMIEVYSPLEPDRVNVQE